MIKAVLFYLALCASVGLGNNEQKSPRKSLMADLREEKFVKFGVLSTKTKTAVQTVTTSAIITCVSGPNAAAACSGRKRRSLFKTIGRLADIDLAEQLDGSKKDPGNVPTQFKVHREGKKLTVFSTSFSSLTITSTSYLTGTTLTISLACDTAGGVMIPEACIG